METYTTTQFAYAGKYALKDNETARLVATRASRPRLYGTIAAATDAAAKIGWCSCSPVRLEAAPGAREAARATLQRLADDRTRVGMASRNPAPTNPVWQRLRIVRGQS